ncbi:MAG: hypothetical protein DME49_09495 [Verrucomicrobia bacterium]|nr:MAG: hypothetical protein DME49_09495 [Verrucomicrobiota bacterium]PYK92422.1 MAG: hypothetical protein DME36_13390 [Verrucomicrobiota bacterium]PYL38057.1 MAG: hypothetical protein DMF34_08310 [Verrucomicrobiota bacterium]PYL58549.1 MAG: hypothetical protein DMF30_02440 [Verrucomicrobiota bacterium]
METPARFLLVEPGDVDHCLVAGLGCTGVLELGRCSVAAEWAGSFARRLSAIPDFMTGRSVGERAAGEENDCA